MLTAYSAYVYDDSARLIEEYDRTGSQPALIARYYYASGDSPAAADLWDPGSGTLKRYYFIRDASQSVIAVADASGNVVERVWYDAYGQPNIELRDTLAPTLQSVVAGSSNLLLVVLSEPVVKPLADPGAGGGPVAIQLPSGAGLLSVSVNATNTVPGTTVLLPSSPGAAPYSVLQFTPSQGSPLSGAVTLTLNAGSLADEWGNVNQQATASFPVTNNQPGTVYFTAQAATNTAPTQVARSSVGSPFLFHGQYFDYDAGLIYLRSRYYDPYSGMFFERDPLGYENSVNHYAGMDNNPTTLRDPTGLAAGPQRVQRIATKGGSSEEAYSSRAVHAEGVDERVLAGRAQVREQLIKEGMGDHNQTALIAALRELLPRSGFGTVEIALKHQNNPLLVRYLANEGLRQKAEWIIKKSKLGALRTGKGVYAGDVDGLWIKVDGVLLDYKQTKAVCDRANEITKNLGETFAKARQDGDKGFARMWEKASNMFKHGFTANLMEEIGLPHYHGNGETRGAKWIKEESPGQGEENPGRLHHHSEGHLR